MNTNDQAAGDNLVIDDPYLEYLRCVAVYLDFPTESAHAWVMVMSECADLVCRRYWSRGQDLVGDVSNRLRRLLDRDAAEWALLLDCSSHHYAEYQKLLCSASRYVPLQAYDHAVKQFPSYELLYSRIER